ncbi:GTP cyclohydrolase N terminal-domain-containing protein [Hypoxylon sp. FL1284]|nr:GTP cyclohydrolase N terminal-domain-containing protein [Hypoxylon sp. FL1284]
MASSGSSADGGVSMAEVLQALKAIRDSQSSLAAEVQTISNRLDTISPPSQSPGPDLSKDSPSLLAATATSPAQATLAASEPDADNASAATKEAAQAQKSGFTSRIILTTYPKQTGIAPVPLRWGAPDATERGPVVVSRSSSTIRRRNAIGAHGGSYSIYFALALASKQLNANHRPDFTNTEPAVNIGPFPSWGDKKKIVAMDPWGHLPAWLFKDLIEKEDGT